MNSRTIAAISTPQGTGGIAVIRISGNDAVAVADRVFSGSIKNARSHTVHYGHILKNGEPIDEVLLTVMLAPRTFTREDTVEISCHGGSAATHAVLGAVIEAGAYVAEPGEFTKRAFTNGRIDLSQAEAVIDVINAKNELSRRNAVMQLGGTLSLEIKSVRDRLVHLSAQMQVIIDCPDEDLEDVDAAEIERVCRDSLDRVGRLLKSADNGRLIRDGIRCAIVGKPNVGKSSILNRLAGSERAIVTDIAGTTRDVIEETVSIDGIPIVLSDTAGIRETDDTVEKIGVDRSMRYIDGADIVIVVIDAETGLDEEDKAVLSATENKKRIVLVNKTDIADGDDALGIAVSAVTGAGMDRLAAEIARLCRIDEIRAENRTVITNMRHKSALADAYKALADAADAIRNGVPTDIASIDIAAAMDALGEITGETVSESVVDEIFHNFCVGK